MYICTVNKRERQRVERQEYRQIVKRGIDIKRERERDKEGALERTIEI